MTRIFKAILLSAVIIAFHLSSIYSATYTWKSVAVRGGGFTTGTVFHPLENGLVYARTDMGGAYRWNTADGSWTPITDSLTRNNSDYMGILSIAVDPSNVNKVYMLCGKYTQSWAGNGAVMASNDKGNTWSINPVNFKVGGNEVGRGAGERLAVDPNLGSIIFAGSSGSSPSGLWKSTNSGASFTQVTSFPQNTINFIIFDKASGTTGNATQTIYVSAAVHGSSLYKSTNGGTSWSLVPNQPGGLQAFRGVLVGTTLYVTYASNNGPNNSSATGGVYKINTSTNVFTNITPNASYAYSGISVDPQNANNIVVTTLFLWWPHDYVYYSTNGGTNWTEKNASAYWDRTNAPYTSGVNPHWLTDIQIDPYNSDRAFFNTGYGFWETTNLRNAGAVTWRFSNKNLEETVAINIVSPPSGAPLISAMGDYDGFVHSTLDAPGTRHTPNVGTTLSIDFAELLPSKLVKGFNASPYGAYSTNGGTNWINFASSPGGTSGGGTRAIAVSADGNRIVWSPPGASVSYSANNGSSWTTSTGSPPTGFEPVSDRVNSNKFYIFNGVTGYCWVSTNGGQSFAQAGFTASGGVDSWATGDGAVAAVPGNEGHLWATVGRQGLWRSTNSGTSFTKVNNVTEAYRVGFGMAASGYTYPAIYLFGIVGGNLGFYRSIDTGASWERINTDANQYGYVHQIKGDPRVYGRCYVSAEGRGIVYGEPSGAVNTPTRTATRTATRTNTPVPPTATFTRTATRTNTPVPPTATFTRTATRTNTPVPATATFTRTATRTNTPLPPTATFTRTATRTNTPVPPTATFTRTATSTSTSSVLPTATRTATRTATATNSPIPPTLTFTRTATRTATQTNSPTLSATASSSSTPVPPTATFTRTATRTSTEVLTPSSTPQGTLTNTPVVSATFTPTPTTTNTTVPPTPTFTRTATMTNTVVVTPSNTPAGTLTNTPVFSATFTVTPTFTNTTVPPTATFTGTATSTNTAVVTPSNTPEGTLTNTPVVSATFTQTRTATGTLTPYPASPTFTATPTFTTVPSNTLTATPSRTATPTSTATSTSTNSVVPTSTITVSPTRTPTPTRTVVPNTPTITPTYTITPVPDGTILKITKTDTYPNPVNVSAGQGITVEFYATKRCVKAMFTVYTRAFRKILVVEKQGAISAGENIIAIENEVLKNLSPGVYYGQITATGEDGKETRGKAVTIIIVR